jgi:hypothetical protein
MTAAPVLIAEPGVYDGMPAADYHAHPALSASSAKLLLPPSCPALFRHWADNPRPPKREFDRGHAAHGLVLGVGEQVVVVDAADWRTAKAKAARAEAYGSGFVPVLAHEWQAVLDMAAALRRHPIAGPLFEPGTGRAELSIVWDDTDFGVQRRARLDWLKGRLVVDYKTCDSAAPAACAKAMYAYDYHGQLDWYETAVVEAGLVEAPAGLIVWQEKTPPYLVHVTEPDPVALAAGRDRNRKALDIYARCVAADRWPGWADDTITPLALPRWAELAHDRAVDNGDYDTEADMP